MAQSASGVCLLGINGTLPACWTSFRQPRLYLPGAGSMISLQWDLGVDLTSEVLPRVTKSDLSTVMVILQDAAFVCAFAWFVLSLGFSYCVERVRRLIAAKDSLPELADLHET